MATPNKPSWTLYARLSLMMFLQFAVWGAWSVVIAGHMENNLHFTGLQIALVFGTTAWGAIISPLIAGWIADRYMPSQVFTALAHLIGAVLLFVAWKQTEFWPLWGTMLAYSFFYFPTIALTNAIAFHHMGDSDKFGAIRVWGSLGWIAVQTALSLYLAFWTSHSDALGKIHMGDCLIIAAVASVLMAIYSLTLPNTPPTKEEKNPYFFLEAFRLMKNRNFAVLLVISFIVAIELPFYYNLTYLFLTEKVIQGGIGLAPGTAQLAMTLGQWGEVTLMLLLYPMIRYGGMRWTIFLGILGWPLRYAIFAIGHPAGLVIASQALHGICYAFFFAGGMIAAERLSSRDLRASAQGLMVFATNGAGMLVGHFVSGMVDDHYRFTVMDPATGQQLVGHHWAGVWTVPIIVTIVAGIAFISLFNEKKYREDTTRIREEEEALPPFAVDNVPETAM